MVAPIQEHYLERMEANPGLEKRERKRERVLHFQPHRLQWMQVLPGHVLANPIERIKQKVACLLFVTVAP